MQPDGRPYPAPVAVPGAPPGPVLFTARLYPANDIASRALARDRGFEDPSRLTRPGRVTLAHGGETLSGESTRTSTGGVQTGSLTTPQAARHLRALQLPYEQVVARHQQCLMFSDRHAAAPAREGDAASATDA